MPDKDQSNATKNTRRTVSFTVPNLPRLQDFKRPNFASLIIGIFIALIAGFGGAWVESQGSDTSSTGGEKVVTSESQLISDIAKNVGQSVVSVNVNITTSGAPDLGIFGYSLPQQHEQAAGTGIIISSDGLVVTNRHVVPSGTTKVSVTLSDGTELKDVKVIGRTNESDSLDVAFLKINNTKGHDLKPASLGDSSSTQVGNNVVAIGNALGQFQNTVTSGIISGFGRSVQAGGDGATAENLDDLLQTDAAINEGNSGGPLVNLNGQVIGINTAVAGNAQSIGFAIPINDVRGLVDQVLKTGKFTRPYLGVFYIPLTADVASAYDLNQEQGAFVPPSEDMTSPSVIPGSPADKAGLRERDIITKVDGQAVDQTHSLTSLLARHQPGDRLRLVVIRDDKTLNLSVELGSQPKENR
jgi:S1-C subfamily serine protease